MLTFAVRLPPGGDLKAELTRLTAEHALHAGCVLSCVGSLSQARLRMPSGPGEEAVFRTFNEPLEIISLSGTLSPDRLHLHMAVARRTGACVGGHLTAGCVIRTTVELVIADLPGIEFRRLADPATGYAELSIQPLSAGDQSLGA